MLSNQRSPYVGRFAYGWHRLPRRHSPGNHRPRQRARHHGTRVGPNYARNLVLSGTAPPRDLAAAARVTRAAPVCLRTPAHSAAVDPVVSTSSTRSTRPGAGLPFERKAPCRAARRSAPLRRACDLASRVRTRSLTTGTPRRAPTCLASTSAWSNPLRERRRLDNGTHVTTSASTSEHTSTMAADRCPARACTPANFRALIASAMGPSYRNGAREPSITGGGQSAHSSRGSSHGRPHLWHHGGVTTPTRSVQSEHSGQAPAASHEAQRPGNRTSRRPTTVDVTRGYRHVVGLRRCDEPRTACRRPRARGCARRRPRRPRRARSTPPARARRTGCRTG